MFISPAYAQTEVIEKSFGVFEREGVFALLLFFALIAIMWLMKKWSDAKTDLARSEAERRIDLKEYTTKVEEFNQRLAIMIVDATKSDLGGAAATQKHTEAVQAIGAQVVETKGMVSGVLSVLSRKGG